MVANPGNCHPKFFKGVWHTSQARGGGRSDTPQPPKRTYLHIFRGLEEMESVTVREQVRMFQVYGPEKQWSAKAVLLYGCKTTAKGCLPSIPFLKAVEGRYL
jgi:hypothetical protein